MKEKTKTKRKGRKEAIYIAAQNLFRERGYAATSMRDLANAVGIEAASLYSHIKSKEEILQSICFEIAAAFFTALEEVKKSDESAEVKLQKAIHAHIGVITTHLNASAVFLHEWRFLNDEHPAEFKKQRSQYEQIFLDIIEQGIAEGSFKNIDPKFYCLTLFSSLNWTYDWYKPNGRFSVEEVSEQLSQLLLNGIKQ